MTRAGTDDERRLTVRDQPTGVTLRLWRQPQVPAQQPLGDAESRREAEEAIEYVLAGTRRDACVGEQPLQLTRARAVEPELDARRDAGRYEARAHRQLHVQQHLKAAPRELAAQRSEPGEAGALVDGDKLHPVEKPHETRLASADDPGELRCRPRLL